MLSVISTCVVTMRITVIKRLRTSCLGRFICTVMRTHTDSVGYLRWYVSVSRTTGVRTVAPCRCEVKGHKFRDVRLFGVTRFLPSALRFIYCYSPTGKSIRIMHCDLITLAGCFI